MGVLETSGAVVELPDIYIDKIEIVPFQGDQFKNDEKALIKCSVKRNETAVGDFHVAFYQGTNFLKEIRVQPNQFKNGVIILEAGFKYNSAIKTYSCVADSRNKIKESDEVNNRKEHDISTQPQTLVSVITIPTLTQTVVSKPVNDIQPIGMYMRYENGQFTGQVYCFFHHTAENVEVPWESGLIYGKVYWRSQPSKGEYGAVIFKIPTTFTKEMFNGKAICSLDNMNVIKETDEQNNRLVYNMSKNFVPRGEHFYAALLPYQVVPRRDFEITALEWEAEHRLSSMASMIPKGKFKCKWVYKGDADLHNWKINLTWNGSTIDQTTIITSSSHSEGLIEFKFNGMDSGPEQMIVKCIADPVNEIKENNEDNNTGEHIFK
ncbi:MAG: hypothetical protein JW737_05740 [Acidobacteria bacterium]|nr:hypothetical protein [Acidobacteriota bacterium]